jgi:hypothetical protein
MALAALGILSGVLSGCSVLSPDTIATPYPPGDGINATVTNPADGSSVDLRNFLVVAAAEGTAGRVVGAVVNTGAQPVELSLAAAQGASTTRPTTVEVPPGGITQVGSDDGTQMILEQTPGAGRMIAMRAATTSGGAVDMLVPVLAPVGFYATLTPPPTPTATPLPAPAETPSAVPSATPSATTSP